MARPRMVMAAEVATMSEMVAAMPEVLMRSIPPGSDHNNAYAGDVTLNHHLLRVRSSIMMLGHGGSGEHDYDESD